MDPGRTFWFACAAVAFAMAWISIVFSQETRLELQDLGLIGLGLIAGGIVATTRQRMSALVVVVTVAGLFLLIETAGLVRALRGGIASSVSSIIGR